jgi:hypothetical protein
MMGFLGLHSYYSGVSWDPFICFPSPNTAWPHLEAATGKAIQERMIKVGP